MFKKISIAAIVTCLAYGLTIAQIPQQINYQGMLTDGDGYQVTDTLKIEFRIYNSDNPSATPMWSEVHNDVKIINGGFNILLGSIEPIPYSVFSGGERFLGIIIDSGLEMMPRKKLVSVGYSFNAFDSDRLDGKNASDFMQQLNGVSSGSNGNVDLISGSNVSITPDPTNNRITISATPGGTGGDITAVNAGDGLIGGGASGDVVINVGAGTGITVDANDVSLNTTYSDNRYVNESQSNAISTVMIANNAVTAAKIAPDVVSSVGGVSNDGGNIDMVGGDNITISTDDANSKITISATTSGGDNLGNHSATQNLQLNDHFLSNNGNDQGIKIDNSGSVTISEDLFVDMNAETGGSFVVGGILEVGPWPTFAEIGGIRAVYGSHSSTGNFGYIGSMAYGAYGRHSSGPLGYLGSSDKGGYAYNPNGNYVTLAGDNALFANGNSQHAGYFQGKVFISQNLSVAGDKNFVIDHPLAPSQKYLYHSCIESNERYNIYSGNAILNSDGEITVELPDWFEALNRDFRYQLTCIGDYSQVYIAEEINNNQFKIAGGEPGMKISWQVTGIRNDAYARAHPSRVEEEKIGNERGKYLTPSEHGMPESMGIAHQITEKMKDEQKRIEEEHQRMIDEQRNIEQMHQSNSKSESDVHSEY